MTYAEYNRLGKRFLESEVVDGYSGQPLNLVDGLFAIAKSISDLEDTLGRMPLKNMTEDTVEALNNVAGAIADHGNH
jgi:hypothetical protein